MRSLVSVFAGLPAADHLSDLDDVDIQKRHADLIEVGPCSLSLALWGLSSDRLSVPAE
jgi:hypothetical protein